MVNLPLLWWKQGNYPVIPIYASRERTGNTPTMGLRDFPFISLDRITSSLQGIGLHPPTPEPALEIMETSQQASGELNFSFICSREEG